MAVYRKKPTIFTVDNVSRKRLTSFLPFGGLEINENPLTTSAGSTSDALNMVVDDNSFLTLRPRIIDDIQYLSAKQSFLDYIESNSDYVWQGEVTKLKDGYLFLATKPTSASVVRFTITNGFLDNETQGAFLLELILNSEQVALLDLGSTTHGQYSISETVAIIQARLVDVSPLTNWTWKVGADYIEFTAKTDGEISNSNYLQDYDDETGITCTTTVTQGVSPVITLLGFIKLDALSEVIVVDTIETSVGLKSLDDFIITPEKDYFRFIKKDDGVHYKFYLKDGGWTFEKVKPYIPTYKLAIKDVASIADAPVYEDLNVLSDKYKLSVSYSGESNIDLSVFTAYATEISGNPYIYEELTGMGGKEIVYYSPNGYIYFLASDYTSVIGITSGVRQLNFHYFSFDTKRETIAFSIKVYADDFSHSDGINQQGLIKLYYNNYTKDYNQNNIYKLHYDASSHSLIRVRFTESVVSPPLVPKVLSVDIYQYGLEDSTFYKETIVIGDETKVDDWKIMYTEGNVGIYFKGSSIVGSSLINTIGLLSYSLGDHRTTALIGGVVEEDDNIKFLPAFRPTGDVVRGGITHYFIVNQKRYIVSTCMLDYFLDQETDGPQSNTLTPIGTVTPTEEMNKGCLYYDVDVSIDIDKVIDLEEKAKYTPIVSEYNAVSVSGTQALLYNTLHYRGKQIVRIPVSNLSAIDSLNIGALFAAHPEFDLESMMITAWGVPILFGSGSFTGYGNDLAIVRIDMDSSLSKGLLQYWFQQINYGVAYYGLLFATNEAFDFLNHGATTLRRIVITKDELEYTYDIANNDVNPLKLSAEILDEYQKYVNAYKFMSESHGIALLNSSRIDYNDSHVFVTEPQNYDYIPTIHCHKTVQPIRFVSSYLQEIGVIYERNNIEYVSLADNPFQDTGITSQYIAHSRVFIFNSVEQRAIDYLPNGHLITFTGITVYVNNGGVYALNFDANTPQDSERKASLISAPINAKLLKEDMSTCILANLDPYVLFMFPKSGYTAVYALKILSGLWFYWELPIIVEKVIDDNRHLRLISGTRYIEFTDSSTVISVPMSTQTHEGSVEQYLDFDTDHIKWYWKSQLLTFGSITSQKQITDTFFTFVNPNAGITFDTDTFDITQNKITTQNFGLRFYTYKELISEAPVVAYEGKLNIINNLRRRTYLNRFKYCQLLCYNIEDEDAPSDKVRIANIAIAYKYLTGGR